MAKDDPNQVDDHRVVPYEEWIAARMALLAKEKELTQLRDEVTRQRRELPWEAVTKEYVFDGPSGTQTLSELFDGRSQLVVYHFMFHPDDSAGCLHCSSRASEREGHSVFFKDGHGAVFHTYSCYDRGNEMLADHYHYLDLVPKGRDEEGRGPFWVRRHDEYDRPK